MDRLDVVKFHTNIANRWLFMIQRKFMAIILYSWSYLDMFRGGGVFSGHGVVWVSECGYHHRVYFRQTWPVERKKPWLVIYRPVHMLLCNTVEKLGNPVSINNWVILCLGRKPKKTFWYSDYNMVEIYQRVLLLYTCFPTLLMKWHILSIFSDLAHCMAICFGHLTTEHPGVQPSSFWTLMTRLNWRYGTDVSV